MKVQLPGRLAGALAYRDALENRDRVDFDGADCCTLGDTSSSLRAALADAGEPHPEWAKVQQAKVGDPVPYGGKVIAQIPGMGKVIDWRPSSWTPVNGGKIRPLIYVEHIPVIPQMPGIADFIRLRDVLVAQGLMVQSATDGSGNVALFAPLNYLCYQARGANSFSCGTEHMHYGINDPWSVRQLNAASYVRWRAWKYQGIPTKRQAKLGPGNGVVRVLSRGATTHKLVSWYAGYKDRSDPGPTFERDEERVERGVTYFDRHHDFRGF